MNASRLQPAALALALAMSLAAPVFAATTAKKPASTGQRTVSRVTFIDAPSNEKPAAREKRLRRECRGRPNAGACLGYTR